MSTQKILLIRPFLKMLPQELPVTFQEPLSLEYLASVVRDDHDVSIYDCLAEGYKNIKIEDTGYVRIGVNTEDIQKKIRRYKPVVVGITSSFFSQALNTIEITKAVKETDSSIRTILGGPYPSLYQEKTFEIDQNLDIIVYGEGEITFKQLCDNEFGNLKDIKGIIYRENEAIIKNPPQYIIHNLDEIPFPSRDLVPFKIYSRHIVLGDKRKLISKLIDELFEIPFLNTIYSKIISQHNISSMLTTRGCPNHCTFCSIHGVWGHKYRMRTAENILDEMEILANQFGIKYILMVDDNFTLSKKRTIKVCKGIKERGLDISFRLSSGAYIPSLDREVLTELKNAGLDTIRLPIESGNQEILDNVVCKKLKLDQVKDVIKICNEIGLKTRGFFILGMPGETKETMYDSIKFAATSGLDTVRFFVYMPIPGTPMYDYALENDYIVEKLSLDRIRVEIDNPTIKTEAFSPEDVLEIKKLGEKMMAEKKLRR